MPGYNKTGPRGNGPATGRGMGFCNDANPDYGRRFPGAAGNNRGVGRGRGNRRGIGSDMQGLRGRRFACRRSADMEEYPPEDTVGQLAILKKQADSMQSTLDAITKRMQDLENRTND